MFHVAVGSFDAETARTTLFNPVSMMDANHLWLEASYKTLGSDVPPPIRKNEPSTRFLIGVPCFE